MDELKKITTDDILDKQDVIIITTIPDSKNGKKEFLPSQIKCVMK